MLQNTVFQSPCVGSSINLLTKKLFRKVGNSLLSCHCSKKETNLALATTVLYLLLSCVGKLMERCVYKYMYNFFVSNDIIHQKQSGFLKGHSTVYQLINIYHQVVSSLDSNQNTCMVFCDISKAFDRVWHKGLLFKLQQNGINGCLLNWIKSYLSNRQQAVFVGTAKSKLMNVKAQSSALFYF